jgi:RNA polymerase sigma factor (sigma-70 family)
MPDTLANKSDEELVEIYQSSFNREVLGELFKRHTLLCFAVCNKYLKNEDASHDAVMHIFEQLFELLKKHQISNFRSWLHSVCRNHCLMILRKPQFFRSLTELEEDSENDFMENKLVLHPREEGENLESKLQELENALSGLNQKQQQCIQLFYLEQLSYEEVSKKTGLTLNEVKSALQNGKRNLKNSLAEKGISYLLIWMIWIQQSA